MQVYVYIKIIFSYVIQCIIMLHIYQYNILFKKIETVWSIKQKAK